MEIRKDFSAVSEQLSQLVQYSKVFEKNNKELWPHFVNKEDYSKVYALNQPHRDNFEQLYSFGRDCAVTLSSRLIEFNDVNIRPTLTSFLEYLEGGWVYEVDKLKEISRLAKASVNNIASTPWAISQMILLFDKQIEIVISVRSVLESLKNSDLYNLENGIKKKVIDPPWWSSFDRRIAVSGILIAIISAFIALR